MTPTLARARFCTLHERLASGLARSCDLVRIWMSFGCAASVAAWTASVRDSVATCDDSDGDSGASSPSSAVPEAEKIAESDDRYAVPRDEEEVEAGARGGKLRPRGWNRRGCMRNGAR